MISSRRRFKEFQQKLKQGLLKGDRLIDPDARREPPPDIGGRHSAFSAEKHNFKFTKGRLLSEYRVMLRGYYSSVAILIVVVLITSLAALVPPFILKFLIDDVFRHRPLPLALMLKHYSFGQWLGKTPIHGLLFLTLVLITAEVFSIAASWARMLATQRLNFRLSATLRQRLHSHLSKLPLAQLADYRTGGIISRIMSDTDQVVGGGAKCHHQSHVVVFSRAVHFGDSHCHGLEIVLGCVGVYSAGDRDSLLAFQAAAAHVAEHSG